MDTTPSPPSTPATSEHVDNDEEATARRHACKERDARQSLALSESDFPPLKTSTRRKKLRVQSTTAMPAETMLGCESSDSRDIDISIFSTRESSSSLPSPSSSKQPPNEDPRMLEISKMFQQLLALRNAEESARNEGLALPTSLTWNPNLPSLSCLLNYLYLQTDFVLFTYFSSWS